MAKTLTEWLETDVRPIRSKPVKWLSHEHFFRDPFRPTYCDSTHFFSPADGIILYQTVVEPDEPIIDIKGRHYTLRDALRDSAYHERSLVIGIFLTFFDVHINRIPFSGRLSYSLLEPVDTYNHPLLPVEKAILDELKIDLARATYLHCNQRVVNRVFAWDLGQYYYMLQIADYDVDSIIPFVPKQNQPFMQGERFSQIRFGSQVDLVVPLSRRYEFRVTQAARAHVEAGIDTLIEVARKDAADGN